MEYVSLRRNFALTLLVLLNSALSQGPLWAEFAPDSFFGEIHITEEEQISEWYMLAFMFSQKTE